ncbi:hypothetical protein [Wolbachia endosymbiont (group A) of Trypoxylon clavicerum]|uniref:hypothetical protein n=1 Tax=Wolbachia endosymbiont (group A) of Trypoxylon clavicerum TaxID=2954064 RepID=UPI003877D15F
MQYYFKEENWKQILEFIKSVKGMHSKDEKRLRIFIEAVWYIVRSGCQWRLYQKLMVITGVYISDLKDGVKEMSGKNCLNILNKSLI